MDHSDTTGRMQPSQAVASSEQSRPWHPLTMRFAPDREKEFATYHSAASVVPTRIAYALGLCLYAVFGVLDFLLARPVCAQLWFIRFGLVCPIIFAVVLFTFTTRYAQYQQAFGVLAALTTAVGIIAMTAIAPAPANYYYYAGLILIIIFVYAFIRLRFMNAVPVGWTIVLFYFAVSLAGRATPNVILISNAFFLVSANLVGMLACYWTEAFMRREFMHVREIERERARADHLLAQILPASIAERLKTQGGTIADSYAEATVLFADIVSFTALSSQLLPRDLIDVLNGVFTAFDELADRHGLEKIRTIGDSYMIAGGLPELRDDHAEAMADMALDMLDALRKFNLKHDQSIAVRIGINTGPVVAGVIGTKKLIYDLWGDTVNIASRMESHGVPGEIQVSEFTYQRLKRRYAFEERGLIPLKGRGQMRTYILRGRRGEQVAHEDERPVHEIAVIDGIAAVRVKETAEERTYSQES